jgi:hypothetical protein
MEAYADADGRVLGGTPIKIGWAKRTSGKGHTTDQAGTETFTESPVTSSPMDETGETSQSASSPTITPAASADKQVEEEPSGWTMVATGDENEQDEAENEEENIVEEDAPKEKSFDEIMAEMQQQYGSG